MDFLIQDDICLVNQTSAISIYTIERAAPEMKVVSMATAITPDNSPFHVQSQSEAIARVKKQGHKFATFPLNLENDVMAEFNSTNITQSVQWDGALDTPFMILSTLATITEPSPYLPWAVQKVYDKFEPITMQDLIGESGLGLSRIITQDANQDNKYSWYHFDPFRATRSMLVLKGEGPQFCVLSQDKEGYSEAMKTVLQAYSEVSPGFKNYGLGIVKPENLTVEMRARATELTQDLCDSSKGHALYSVPQGYGVVFKPGEALHRAPLGYKGERLMISAEILH